MCNLAVPTTIAKASEQQSKLVKEKMQSAVVVYILNVNSYLCIATMKKRKKEGKAKRREAEGKNTAKKTQVKDFVHWRCMQSKICTFFFLVLCNTRTQRPKKTCLEWATTT